LNLTLPVLPAAGCTITVQVTSATLGSNANVSSGATSSDTSPGSAAAAAYLTVGAGDEEFLYVHADQIGTPRVITRPSDNAVVWKWDNTDPFGANTPNEDPSNTGITFKFNLRFLGQYYDQETGTHHNYFRDYDPTIGRYIQSDPVGLKGGINTYGYVEGDPVSAVDPYGLTSLVPGSATPKYNCMAWGLGITTSWIQPANPDDSPNTVPPKYGCTKTSCQGQCPCEKNIVKIFEDTKNPWGWHVMKKACGSSKWTSKNGATGLYIDIPDPDDFYNEYYKPIGKVKTTCWCCPK
jgi:RHS repeat-associated protein